jgi:uncharacterized protein (DUF952 family)
MAIIFHITRREAWDQGQAAGSHRPEMFASEGFIHCSTDEQVISVANNRFRGQAGLVLLAIDTDRVAHTIRYENLEGGSQLFPHIYGDLDPNAVMKVDDFTPGDDGYFTMPDAG